MTQSESDDAHKRNWATKWATKWATNNPTILRYLNQILILAKYLDVKEVWVLEVWVLVPDTRFQFLNFTKKVTNVVQPYLSSEVFKKNCSAKYQSWSKPKSSNKIYRQRIISRSDKVHNRNFQCLKSRNVNLRKSTKIFKVLPQNINLVKNRNPLMKFTGRR